MGHEIVFDTEFMEDGRTIDLLSIGMVRDDGETYYAELEADYSKAHPWVVENVILYLNDEPRPKAQVAKEIREFVGEHPMFWAYYADYDWVALCQLYGRMIDLPETWPMYCRDIKQLYDEVGGNKPADPENEHHALADAQWGMDFLKLLKARQNKVFDG